MIEDEMALGKNILDTQYLNPSEGLGIVNNSEKSYNVFTLRVES